MAVPSLVLFDLDQTIFDHRGASRSALAGLQAEHFSLGAVPIVDLDEAAFQILNRTHTKVMAGSLTPIEARIERLRDLFEWCGESIETDRLVPIAERHVQLYRAAWRAFDGAAELLASIGQSQKVGIVTNNFVNQQESKLKECGLKGLIDFMVTSEEVGVPKPATEIFEAALERGGADPGEAVMVGDSWEVDVLGAQAAGIRPVWFNPERIPPPGGDTVEELQSFVPREQATRIILGTSDGPTGGLR